MSARHEYRGLRVGLTSLTVAAGCLLALLTGVAFAVLLWAVSEADSPAAGADCDHAVLAAVVGLTASTALGAGFTVLQHRAVVRPVRGAKAAAEQLAGGDLSVRIVPSKVAEIGALGTSFNTMAASLQDSRRRVMESVEAVQRRTARDLHDGAQQRLVSLMIGLRLARELLADADPAAIDLLDQSIDNAQTAINELRELASGIYPLVLTVKGLAPSGAGPGGPVPGAHRRRRERGRAQDLPGRRVERVLRGGRGGDERGQARPGVQDRRLPGVR